MHRRQPLTRESRTLPKADLRLKGAQRTSGYEIGCGAEDSVVMRKKNEDEKKEAKS
jgi:hypothetical protein